MSVEIIENEKYEEKCSKCGARYSYFTSDVKYQRYKYGGKHLKQKYKLGVRCPICNKFKEVDFNVNKEHLQECKPKQEKASSKILKVVRRI